MHSPPGRESESKALLDEFMVALILAEDQRVDQILPPFPTVSLGGLRRIRWRAQANRCGVEGVVQGTSARPASPGPQTGLRPEAVLHALTWRGQT
jgi:hypothetical protein